MGIIGGATIWARQTIESEIFYWKPPAWFKIWFYIISKVNHKDNRLFKRGENYFNWSEEKQSLKKISRNQWYECLEWLKKQNMITTRKTTRGIVIFVVNYAKYQNFNTYKTEAKTDTATEAHPKHTRSTPDTINKNDKNDKNDKKNMSQATDLMNLEEFKKWCDTSSQRHIRLIGEYATIKGVQNKTRAQWQSFIKRNLRPAQNLAPYEDGQIIEALKRIDEAKEKYLSKWTLETISKYLEQNL